jgi:tetratricopeptide (TPR) repeat protein
MYQADEKQSLIYAQKISDLNESFCRLKPDADSLKATWGHSLLLLGQYYDTTKVFSEAFKCGEKANAIFTDLVKKSPKNLEYHFGLARSYCVMSREIIFLGAYKTGLEYAKSYLSEMEFIIKRDATNFKYQEELALAYVRYSISLRYNGDNSNQRKYLKKSIELYEKLVKANPANIYLAKQLAYAYVVMGDAHDEPRESQNWSKKGLLLFQELVEENPRSVECKDGLAHAYRRMHFLSFDPILKRQVLSAEARKDWQKAADIWSEILYIAPPYLRVKENLKNIKEKL